MFRCLLLIMLLFTSLFAYGDNKGLKRIFSDEGNEVTRYAGSHALLIGVSDYTNGWPDLKAVPGELDEVRKSLETKGFDVQIVMDPDSKALEDAYESFIDRYGYDRDNRLLFFYSGHGYSTDEGTKGFLVPTDAPNPNKDMRDFKRKSLQMSRLLSLSREMEANHVLFLFDSCFSGTIFKTRALPKLPPYIEQSMAKPVRQFITAGSADEEVPAQSVFAPLFSEGIDGKADLNHDGYITGSELGMFLSDNVPRFKRQNPQYGKIDDYRLSRGDFIFLAPSTKRSLPAPSKGEITTRNTAKYVGDKRWDWTVYIDTDQKTLSSIDHVQYTLHPTFPNPVREVYDPRNGFALSSNGWGTFVIEIKVFFKDGSTKDLRHKLRFEQ